MVLCLFLFHYSSYFCFLFRSSPSLCFLADLLLNKALSNSSSFLCSWRGTIWCPFLYCKSMKSCYYLQRRSHRAGVTHMQKKLPGSKQTPKSFSIWPSSPLTFGLQTTFNPVSLRENSGFFYAASTVDSLSVVLIFQQKSVPNTKSRKIRIVQKGPFAETDSAPGLCLKSSKVFSSTLQQLCTQGQLNHVILEHNCCLFRLHYNKLIERHIRTLI